MNSGKQKNKDISLAITRLGDQKKDFITESLIWMAKTDYRAQFLKWYRDHKLEEDSEDYDARVKEMNESILQAEEMLAQIVQFFTGKNKSIIDNLNKKADKSKKERKGKATSKTDKEKTATAGESPAAVKRAAMFKKNSLLNQSAINIDKYMPGEALDARVLSIEMEQHLKEKSLERRKQSVINYQKANLSGELLQRTIKAKNHTRLIERMTASIVRSRMPTFAIYSRLDKHLL